MTTSLAPLAPLMTPEVFIDRWDGVAGSERANYQLFFDDLCDLLGVPKRQPAHDDDTLNAYVAERYIKSLDGLSAGTSRFIDVYCRGSFIFEAKSFNTGKPGNQGAENKLTEARAQAEAYARALPDYEPRPVFLIVANVGRYLALYAQFNDGDRSYAMYPDKASYKIAITDLAKPEVRERLRQIWLNPQALNPELISAEVTRQVSLQLAELARTLEQQHRPQQVAAFLTRSLFTMFAEDVGLLPEKTFTRLLSDCRTKIESLPHKLEELWAKMDKGGYSVALDLAVPHFNGKLFKDPSALPLTLAQIEALLSAAKQDWRHVEPAIFGTLIERALSTDERHSLGAHYTPRAYVERLVWPTVIEPLRAQWQLVQTAALTLGSDGKLKDARDVLMRFHYQLCQTTVLDPACGSGNFLYIAMEHMKRLEGEVLALLEDFGASAALETEGLTVDPHQFLGIELNPRAAAVAELVLWIGYLQWHYRTKGSGLPPTPILRDFKNIECRDAVLAYSGTEPVLDEHGQPQTRWDGKTRKPHPVTGELVPDDSVRVPLLRYLNPSIPDWPRADYIVGNPPFIGARTIRLALGDGYLDAVRNLYPDVPDNADFVMYWWHRSAEIVAKGMAARFGLITTNSLRQTFNRAVLERWLADKIRLSFAIPDHPWVDSADGAAVRVAMTVGGTGSENGRLSNVLSEASGENDEIVVTLSQQTGQITPGLTIGVDAAAAPALRANEGICCVGYQLTGKGFRVDAEQARQLDPLFGQPRARIRRLVTGSDITQSDSRGFAIDLFGLNAETVRAEYPAIYQWVYEKVKPERDHNNRSALRERWWIFGEARSTFRPSLAGCDRAIAASLTAKHRTFVFVDAQDICDSTTVMFALPDAFHLGILSSRVHVAWALAAGGTLEDRPRYNKSRCFEPFPFPAATLEQQARIRELAEALDAHRKKVLATHASLTLTGLYNVLEKLKTGTTLTAKEQQINTLGLVSVLRSLHDDLDHTVVDAYGWWDLQPLLDVAQGHAAKTDWPMPAGADRDNLYRSLPTDRAQAAEHFSARVLERLVALNAERQREEAQGHVRWLRPEFQNPAATPAPQTGELAVTLEQPATVATPITSKASPWPKTLLEQVKAVSEVLQAVSAPLDAEQLASQFSRLGKNQREALLQIIATLESVHRVQRLDDGRLQWLA
ncbi:class I SAM-dependent DNA methyltransferase [Chitinilyticum litopenaei]|uniref:class I SAM-dependent DNA methyltransferase n=1 Tax=Chitinilyticum litopenaei TaxID=1121276 RepID=UPI000410A85C|nr:DNA methyltransferase [Chitinilyticum litopenaei]